MPDQGGLEPLPILLCAVDVSHFATYSITFYRRAEFCRFSHRGFLVEFGAMERKKVWCISLLCRLCCYLVLRAKKWFAPLENPPVFDEFIWNGWRVTFYQKRLSKNPFHTILTWSLCRKNNMTSKKNKLWLKWTQRSRKVASYCLRSKQLKIPLFVLNELCNVFNRKWRAGSVTFCWTYDKVVAFSFSWNFTLFRFLSLQ